MKSPHTGDTNSLDRGEGGGRCGRPAKLVSRHTKKLSLKASSLALKMKKIQSSSFRSEKRWILLTVSLALKNKKQNVLPLSSRSNRDF